MFWNALATAQQHCCRAVGGKRIRFVPFSGGTPMLEVGVLYRRGELSDRARHHTVAHLQRCSGHFLPRLALELGRFGGGKWDTKGMNESAN